MRGGNLKGGFRVTLDHLDEHKHVTNRSLRMSQSQKKYRSCACRCNYVIKTKVVHIDFRGLQGWKIDTT